jgi:hypothetical protein
MDIFLGGNADGNLRRSGIGKTALGLGDGHSEFCGGFDPFFDHLLRVRERLPVGLSTAREYFRITFLTCLTW